jgi:hypothetical protein
VAKGGAACTSRVLDGLQVAASDVEYRINQEVLTTRPERAETDPLGVSQQPGCLMVGRGHLAAQTGDTELDREFSTLRAQRGALR